MKRKLALTLAMLMTLALTAWANPAISESATDEVEVENKSNILVAYFSSAGNIAEDETVQGNIGKGNTRLVAELIQGQVGGDLFSIETVNKYSANYRDAIAEAMQELRDDARPKLATHVENIDDYDVVYLGYPNWWGALPRAVLTFLAEYDLSGKTVIPFCTYEDSGVGRSIAELETALPSATLLKEFSTSERDLEGAEEAIKQWLSELNLPK